MWPGLSHGDGALDVARSLTSLPVGLVNTHADRDHIAGNTAFEHFMMHPAEAANYYNLNGGKGDFTPLEDGQVLELGGRRIEVVLIPGHTPGSIALLDEDRRMLGHTPGSIALLDEDRRMLFPGDSVQDGDIYMFGPMREMHAYIHSLARGDVDTLRPRPSVAWKPKRGQEHHPGSCNEGPAVPRGETREESGRTDGRDACHET